MTAPAPRFRGAGVLFWIPRKKILTTALKQDILTLAPVQGGTMAA